MDKGKQKQKEEEKEDKKKNEEQEAWWCLSDCWIQKTQKLTALSGWKM